jgi:hypothetical protein
MAGEEGPVPLRIARCTIHYKDTDQDNGINGQLIYLKPTIVKTEPPDLYTYARESDSFPHESTADQWFSEAQFECYRVLGELMAAEIPWGEVPPAKGRRKKSADVEAKSAGFGARQMGDIHR